MATFGVRLALYLESGNLVSDSTDTDGAYILQWNQPPSDPSSISYGTPQAGNSLVLSTGGSTDPEGDAISYVWERKIDSGAYVQLGKDLHRHSSDVRHNLHGAREGSRRERP